MMDLSSIVDAGLVLAGSVAVLAMGLWTLSSESSTVSASDKGLDVRARRRDVASLPKAA
jgi:hypothetical protein